MTCRTTPRRADPVSTRAIPEIAARSPPPLRVERPREGTDTARSTAASSGSDLHNASRPPEGSHNVDARTVPPRAVDEHVDRCGRSTLCTRPNSPDVHAAGPPPGEHVPPGHPRGRGRHGSKMFPVKHGVHRGDPARACRLRTTVALDRSTWRATRDTHLTRPRALTGQHRDSVGERTPGASLPRPLRSQFIVTYGRVCGASAARRPDGSPHGHASPGVSESALRRAAGGTARSSG